MIENVNKKTPADRLEYSGDLRPILERVCIAYNVGKLTDFSIIEIGYEDCNTIIETSQGKYLAKIFAKTRTPETITRYSTIMEKVVEVGVHHPPLLKTHGQQNVYTDNEVDGLTLVLLKFIEGKTFFDLDRTPNEQELHAILEQAALINKVDCQPSSLFDSWAIPNIASMLERTKEYIQPADLKLVQQVIEKYNTIPVNKLPHCFVHGDLTKANVLKTDDGKIYILDFSVANWYPRIQELAVISANLLHDTSPSNSLLSRTEHVAKEYSKFNPLTPEEHLHLYNYTLAAVAMEFMGSHQEKYINGNDTEETNYWFNLGREGLIKALIQNKNHV